MASEVGTAVRLGKVIPDFSATTNEGKFDSFHEFIGDSWAVLFSHPRDFTPVCTTELGEASKRAPDFASRGVKMVALSCDPADSHSSWAEDIAKHTGGTKLAYPIIADPTRELAVQFDMLDEEEKDLAGLPVTVRSVFVIGPDKKVKLMLTYPPAVGRNFDEILRAIDALQLGASKPVATPVNWTPGSEVMVLPSVSDEDAAKLDGYRKEEMPSGKGYMRFAAGSA